MARIVKLVSAKSGATANTRRVLQATGTTTLSTATNAGVLLEGPRYAWISFKTSGVGSATVDLYAYDPVSTSWLKLLPTSEFQFTVSEDSRFRILLEGGPVRIQPVVSAFTLTSLDVWISSSVEEP